MANETCDYKVVGSEEVCGLPAFYFYAIGPKGKTWRCNEHQDYAPTYLGIRFKKQVPEKTGDPIPGMVEPPSTQRDGTVYDVQTGVGKALFPGTAPTEDDAMRPWPSEREQLTSSPGGVKFDSQKVRHDLLSVMAVEGLSRVLTYGAAKYEAHNWRKGIDWSRVQAALLRHFFAFMAGEDIDPESGLPHIDHVMCNAMFLSEFQKANIGNDDRFLEGK